MTFDLTHVYEIQCAAIRKLNLHTEALEQSVLGRKEARNEKEIRITASSPSYS